MKSLTNNLNFDSIYLDFAKAFDKVDHEIRMKKLQIYGIHPKMINWIRSFLTNRMQGVVVNGQISFLAMIISGVPQGTVLRPILFLIFINDIAHCVSDDTRVSKAIWLWRGCLNTAKWPHQSHSVVWKQQHVPTQRQVWVHLLSAQQAQHIHRVTFHLQAVSVLGLRHYCV